MRARTELMSSTGTSRSLKEVVRALGGVLSSPTPSYPLADDVQEVIRLYLDRHEEIEDQDSQRLQDELLNLYHKFVAQDSTKQPAFLGALRHLRLAIRGEDRLLEWWKLLLRPTFDRLGHDSTVAAAARELLLSVLVYDDDDDLDGELAHVSELFAQEVLDVYLEKTSIPGVDHEGDFAVDDHARLIGNHLESVLVDFGRKKPKVRVWCTWGRSCSSHRSLGINQS